MHRARPAAFACAVLIGLAAATATAQTVPVPRPAPQPKAGVVPPPATGPAATPSPPLSLAPSVQPLPRPAIPPGAVVAQPGGTIAFDAQQRALVERVNAYLTGMQTLVGDFVQVAADGGRTEGKFYLQKPGKVRFEYKPPNPVEVIADGQSLVVRDSKLNTQDLYPLSQTPLRFLLADRIDLLKDANLVGVHADTLFVTVVIEERQAIGGTHRLMLMFGARDFELRQWTITDPQGYDTTVAVYNLDKTKKLDPALFKINYERVLQ